MLQQFEFLQRRKEAAMHAKLDEDTFFAHILSTHTDDSQRHLI